ncbi:MAG TPA: ferritin-like domain-containing protein [Gaiellales bacterium]
MQLNSLNDVFAEQVADLRSAEQQLIEALPKMAEAASESSLREAFTKHLDETRTHAERIGEVIQQFGGQVPDEECKAMQGLIEEGQDIIGADGDPVARDTALIAAAQRVEHYEIAAYGTARTLAQQLELRDAAALLEQTLEEERKADGLLNRIATGGMLSSGLNEQAASR